jgi:hypothetical protein
VVENFEVVDDGGQEAKSCGEALFICSSKKKVQKIIDHERLNNVHLSGDASPGANFIN